MYACSNYNILTGDASRVSIKVHTWPVHLNFPVGAKPHSRLIGSGIGDTGRTSKPAIVTTTGVIFIAGWVKRPVGRREVNASVSSCIYPVILAVRIPVIRRGSCHMDQIFFDLPHAVATNPEVLGRWVINVA